jgi:hypothetical protein
LALFLQCILCQKILQSQADKLVDQLLFIQVFSSLDNSSHSLDWFARQQAAELVCLTTTLYLPKLPFNRAYDRRATFLSKDKVAKKRNGLSKFSAVRKNSAFKPKAFILFKEVQ